MQVARSNRSKALTPAFSRRLRTSVLLVAICAVTTFAVTLEAVLRGTNRRSQIGLARICAAALEPGPNGHLWESVEDLQDRVPRLVAVATLDGSGHLESVYPERPGHRNAVNSLLAGNRSRAVIRDPREDRLVRVEGVALPLNGSASPSARQVLVLLRSSPHTWQWFQTTAIFTTLVGLAAWFSVHSMGRWFDRRVTVPLRGLVRAVRDPNAQSDSPNQLVRGEWRETVEIAGLFEGLLQGVKDGEARVRRVEREAQQRIRVRERGFNQALRRARDQATTDALTQLRNRAYLSSLLEPLFEVQKKRSADLTAVMIDIDNFKHYNDAFGHAVGDALLRFVGTLLRSAIRPADHAIRYGGDEFLLLLPDTSLQEARAVTERLVKLFGQYIARLGSKKVVSLSAGVATIQTDGADSGADLVHKADTALYTAKRRGKNTVATSSAA